MEHVYQDPLLQPCRVLPNMVKVNDTTGILEISRPERPEILISETRIDPDVRVAARSASKLKLCRPLFYFCTVQPFSRTSKS
jgi:hypothetical protein